MRITAAALVVTCLALMHCSSPAQSGSTSSSTSSDLRSPGEPCTDDSQCVGSDTSCISWSNGPYVCTISCATSASCLAGQTCTRASDGYGYCVGGSGSSPGGGGGGGAAPPKSNQQYTCACAYAGSSAPSGGASCGSGQANCGNGACCPTNAAYYINGQCYANAYDACQSNGGACPDSCG